MLSFLKNSNTLYLFPLNHFVMYSYFKTFANACYDTQHSKLQLALTTTDNIHEDNLPLKLALFYILSMK